MPINPLTGQFQVGNALQQTLAGTVGRPSFGSGGFFGGGGLPSNFGPITPTPTFTPTPTAPPTAPPMPPSMGTNPNAVPPPGGPNAFDANNNPITIPNLPTGPFKGGTAPGNVGILGGGGGGGGDVPVLGPGESLPTALTAQQQLHQAYRQRGGTLDFWTWRQQAQGAAPPSQPSAPNAPSSPVPGAPPPGGQPSGPTPTAPAPTTPGSGFNAGGFSGVINDPDQFGKLLAFLGDPSGAAPIFSGRDLFGLPGQSHPGEQMMQLLGSILTQQFKSQAPRSDRAAGLLEGLHKNDPAALDLSNTVLGRAEGLASEGGLDALRLRLEQDAARRAAQNESRALAAARDQGLLSRGATGQDVAAQASALASQQHGREMSDIERFLEATQQRRLGLAGGLSAQGADVFRALEEQPALRLAQFLSQQQNPALQPLLNFLMDTGQTAISGDIAHRSQPSGFERAAPILGSALGAIGSLGGSAILGNALRDLR